MPLQCWPEPRGAEGFVWRGVGSVEQQEVDPFRERVFQLFRLEVDDSLTRRSQGQSVLIAAGHQCKAFAPRDQSRGLKTDAHGCSDACTGDMQPQPRRDLTTEAEIGRLAAANGFAQDLVDGIPADWQLHQLRQHLEAGQRFLKHAFGSDQLKLIQHIAVRIKTAHGCRPACLGAEGFRRQSAFCRRGDALPISDLIPFSAAD